ncbi:MAG: hypothetical protein RLZZ86_4127 [Cyanobacteriota bacterium]
MVMNRQVLANRYEIQQQLGKKAGRRTFSNWKIGNCQVTCFWW